MCIYTYISSTETITTPAMISTEEIARAQEEDQQPRPARFEHRIGHAEIESRQLTHDNFLRRFNFSSPSIHPKILTLKGI